MQSREGEKKRKREPANGYLTFTGKSKKTQVKTVHMGAVQWLRYAAQNPDTMRLLWTPMSELVGSGHAEMSVGEAFSSYQWAVEQDEASSQCAIRRFFRDYWNPSEKFQGIRELLLTPVPVYRKPENTVNKTLVRFIMADKYCSELREYLMVPRISFLPRGTEIVEVPRMRCEFPPDEPHDPVVLIQVFTLVTPWLLAECVSRPVVRRFVYAALLTCTLVRRVFTRFLERMLHQKMMEYYPAAQEAWPEIWDTQKGGSAIKVLRDMETWPGHWRAIGRILQMKGLCRGNSAVSLADYSLQVIYDRDRPAPRDDPRYTQIGDADGGVYERWRDILPVSKALNLFEAYIRVKNEICFECGGSENTGHYWIPFFVQTDVHGGLVYGCCSACCELGKLHGPNTSCDSIPCSVVTLQYPPGCLMPYARMIQMDLLPTSLPDP